MDYYISSVSPSNDDLQHHGILGMKWGVRRYQNKDGSLTAAGMRRYRDAESDYKKASSRLKEAKRSGNSTEIENARIEKRKAKKQMSSEYDYIKKASRYEKGKELYSKGRTIGSSRATTAGAVLGIGAAYNVVGNILAKSGKIDIQQAAYWELAKRGTQAAAIILSERGNSSLRAYYAGAPKKPKK